jgi:chemotaxis protein histidine kinase CheA
LTAYNPSNAYNNQWATVSNARYDGNGTAKADFGNCNAIVLRCASPKCGNGGCQDASVASAIVAGCVKANDKCKQYGDDLVNYMTAQLVASSAAKVNQQQAAIAQAQAAAEAQAAAAQSEQIAQMQNQMYQMQQQMAQQQAESAQALQEALAQQQAQSEAALESMRSAATDAAKQTEAGITAYQQEAIARGISEDVLARQQVTGQIQTQIEDAETSLVAMKKSMQNAFEYAGCDARGNNCSGPKRVKKWRELASGFLTPYDNAVDSIYDALITAQTVGVDLSEIYMMLNNSCNSWGQYLCPVGSVEYSDDNSNRPPRVCTDGTKNNDCLKKCNDLYDSAGSASYKDDKNYTVCVKNCQAARNCQDCRLLKILTKDDEIYEGWIDTETVSQNQRTVVACASGALNSSALFVRRTRSKNGAGLVDIDMLDRWLHQTEPSKKTKKGVEPKVYCGVEDIAELETKSLSRIINTKSTGRDAFCVSEAGGDRYDSDCPYIAPMYAICDTHPYNYDHSDILATPAERERMNEVIGLKVTVISQQMYKQYEYINATLRRLKTQLQKAVLTSNLQAAGAESEDGASSSGGLVGGSKKNQRYENCSGKDMSGTLYCLRQNYSALAEQINNKKCNNPEKKQLTADISLLKNFLGTDSKYSISWDTSKDPANKEECEKALSIYNIGLIKLENYIADREAERYGSRR